MLGSPPARRRRPRRGHARQRRTGRFRSRKSALASPSSAPRPERSVVARVQARLAIEVDRLADGRPRTPVSSRASRGSRRASARAEHVARASLRSSLARSPSPASQAVTAAWTVRRWSAFLHLGGRQPPGELGQLCRRRRAHRGRVPARPRARARRRRSPSGPSAAKRQVARTLLQVGKQLRQAAMERSALGAARPRQYTPEASSGWEKRMRSSSSSITFASSAGASAWLRISADGSRPRAPASAAIEPMPPAARPGSPVEAT